MERFIVPDPDLVEPTIITRFLIAQQVEIYNMRAAKSFKFIKQ